MQTNAKTARPGAERKRPDRKPKKQAPARKVGPQTAQQTIPYREIFKDGINADRVGKDYKREVIKVSSDKTLKLHMAPGGGFVVKITK